MKSWHDEDLMLHFYGEHPDGELLERALAEDAALAARLAALARDLAPLDHLPAPAPRPGLESRTWARLRPRLEAQPPRRPAWLGLPSAWRLAGLAVLLVAALAAAFVAGRSSAPPPPATAALDGLSPLARERLLRASLGSHIESSELLLTGVVNSTGDATLAGEREWAASLLASNRLYRQAAARAGQRRIVSLLDELEPLLVELSHSRDGGDLDAARHRIEQRDLLFKVRAVGGRLEPLRGPRDPRSTSNL